MIRLATVRDLDAVCAIYEEHFEYEKTHTRYTVFEKGVYPTRQTAKEAVENQSMYVFEEEGKIVGSVILDHTCPSEYENVRWLISCAQDQVLVIHLLMVSPSYKGRKTGTELVLYAFDLAKKKNLKAVRLDTGAQNLRAASLYKKLGFNLVQCSSMTIGGKIPHKDHLYFEWNLTDKQKTEGEGHGETAAC